MNFYLSIILRNVLLKLCFCQQVFLIFFDLVRRQHKKSYPMLQLILNKDDGLNETNIATSF